MIRSAVNVIKKLVSGLKVLRRLVCKLKTVCVCVCDLCEHVHDSERKYVADHKCACSGTAL